jgi:hypothetical protein
MWSRTEYGSIGAESESKRKLGGGKVLEVVVVGSGIPSLENMPFPETFIEPKLL